MAPAGVCWSQALERLIATRAIRPAPESVASPVHGQARAGYQGLPAHASPPKDPGSGRPELRPSLPGIHVATQARRTSAGPLSRAVLRFRRPDGRQPAELPAAAGEPDEFRRHRLTVTCKILSLPQLP